MIGIKIKSKFVIQEKLSMRGIKQKGKVIIREAKINSFPCSIQVDAIQE